MTVTKPHSAHGRPYIKTQHFQAPRTLPTHFPTHCWWHGVAIAVGQEQRGSIASRERYPRGHPVLHQLRGTMTAISSITVPARTVSASGLTHQAHAGPQRHEGHDAGG